MTLTTKQVKNAKAVDSPFKLSDGGGLFLLVQPNGAKYWRLAYRFAYKQKTLALGVYPQVSLADAREKRDEARKLLASGIDPSENRKAIKKKTKLNIKPLEFNVAPDHYVWSKMLIDGIEVELLSVSVKYSHFKKLLNYSVYMWVKSENPSRTISFDGNRMIFSSIREAKRALRELAKKQNALLKKVE